MSCPPTFCFSYSSRDSPRPGRFRLPRPTLCLPSPTRDGYAYRVQDQEPRPSDPAPRSPIEASAGTDSGAATWLNWLDNKKTAMVTTIALLLISAFCLRVGSSIRIDTRLRALLPDHTPSLVALNAVSKAKGATDQLTIAVQGPTPKATLDLGRAIAQEVSQWPEAEDLVFEQDLTPFRDHILYWLDIQDLQELHNALKNTRAQGIADQARAGISDVVIPGHAVTVDDEDWDQEYEDSPQKAAPSPEDKNTKPSTQTLPERIESMRERFLKDPRLRRSQALAIWPQAWTQAALEDPAKAQPWQPTVQAPVQNPEGTIALITARMSRPPTDVAFVSELQTRFAEVLTKVAPHLDQGNAEQGPRAQLVGSYAISGDVDMIMSDLKNATALSVFLVVAVLTFGFGTWRALVVVVAPVMVSMAITLALAQLIFGELNVLTAFLFAVLFGMGVDFSVHLYMQRLKGAYYPRWSSRIAAHWRPLASTMLTTAGALLALVFGEFQAFQEFGLISAIGVSTCFLAALLLVPSLDILLGRPAKAQEANASSPTRRWPKPIRIVGVALVLLVCALGIGKLSFETNTRNLRAPKPAHMEHKVIPYGEAQGTDRTSVPTILYSEDSQALTKAVDKLRDPKQASWVKGAMSIATILPAQQAEKRELLGEINRLSAELKTESQEYKPALEVLEKLSQAQPIEASQLPEWTRAPFTTRDGAVDHIAHAHLRFAAHDLNEIQTVVHKLRALLEPYGVMGATTSFVFADLGQLITLDAQTLPAIAFGIIALCLWVDLRKLGPTLACLGALALGLALSLATLGLFDVRINFFNLAVLPAVVGLGIDASIHLWHARGRSLGATGRASLVAGATTCAAFAGLLVASHPGLRSMAQVGLISITACVGTAFLLFAGWQRPAQ